MDKELNNVWSALKLGLISKEEYRGILLDIIDGKESHLNMEVQLAMNKAKANQL